MKPVDRTIALKPGTVAILRSKIMQRNALQSEINFLLEVAANENGIGDGEEYSTDDGVTMLIVFKNNDGKNAKKKPETEPSGLPDDENASEGD